MGAWGPGSWDGGWGHQVFPKLEPKARRPQQRAPTEPYSWLFPTPPESPGSPGSRHSYYGPDSQPHLAPTSASLPSADLPFSPHARPFPIPRRSPSLLPNSSPLRRLSSACRRTSFRRPRALVWRRGSWTSPPPTQTRDLPVVGAGSELASERRRGGSGGCPVHPHPHPQPPPPAGTEQNREKSAFI